MDLKGPMTKQARDSDKDFITFLISQVINDVSKRQFFYNGPNVFLEALTPGLYRLLHLKGYPEVLKYGLRDCKFGICSLRALRLSFS